MSRLIDADALMYEANSDGAYGYVDAKQISEAPTIDDVEVVVRCRECKYSRINHLMKKDILSCENIDVCGEEYLFERNPNDFCSYGEKRRDKDGTT